MKKIPSFIRVGLFLAFLAFCGFQVVKAATAAPLTIPIAKDAEKSERTAVSRVGGSDLKDPMPPLASDTIGGNGVVEPASRETKVAAQVSAVVEKVLVVEGQQVKANEVLVQLSNAVELAAVGAAEAEVAAERANFSRAARGLRVEDRDAVAAEAQAAQSRAELSSSVLVRTEQLAKSGASSTEELDRARRAAQTDAATFKAAESRLRAAAAGSRNEDISFARARVAAAEARVAQAKAALERLTIRAPLNGEVLQVKIRPGELYSFSGGEPLLVLGDTSKLHVRMDVDERDVARLKIGQAAFVRADAYGETRFTGRVLEIGRRFGRKNIRTDDPTEKNDIKILEVVIELDTHERLMPGQRVVSFITVQR
jgi:HlyD family secretion protein